MNIFKHSGKYKHFKGGQYKLICNVDLGGEEMVLYLSEKSDSYWLRTPEVFFEICQKNGETYPRFEKTEKFNISQATKEYNAFITRAKNGEGIIFEATLEKYSLESGEMITKINQNPQPPKIKTQANKEGENNEL